MGTLFNEKYHEHKDDAFKMPFHDAVQELERLGEKSIFDRSPDEETRIVAFRDALTEREAPGAQHYSDVGPRNSPSLEDKHGHGPIPPK